MLIGVLVSALGVAFAAQSKSKSIQGAWKITQATTTGPNGRTISNPQPSLYLFTAKHYAILAVNGDQPRPDLGRGQIPTASADELRAVWNPFTANAGTYELSGDSLTIRAIVAKNPAAMPKETIIGQNQGDSPARQMNVTPRTSSTAPTRMTLAGS